MTAVRKQPNRRNSISTSHRSISVGLFVTTFSHRVGQKFASNTGFFQTSYWRETLYNTRFSQYCCEKSHGLRGIPGIATKPKPLQKQLSKRSIPWRNSVAGGIRLTTK